MSPPPIFGHSQKLYDAFLRLAVQPDEDVARDFGVSVDSHIYIGHWSKEFVNDPGLPGESTRQKAYSWLQEKGCIEVLRPGGREYKGVILLIREPELDDLRSEGTQLSRNGQIGVLRVATEGLTRKTNELESGLTRLSAQFDVLTRDVELSLRKHAARIEYLERAESGDLNV